MNTSKISIEDISKLEGDSGSTVFEFTVTLMEAATDIVTVDYLTGGGTASAVIDADYTPKQGTLTFNVGETEKTISVTVFGDNKFESDETFNVYLQNAVNATIEDGTAVATIQNDDTQGETINDNNTPNDTSDDIGANQVIFNSNLGSTNVLYLDMDGHTFSSNVWASHYTAFDNVTAGAYSTDASVLESLWSQVAEDFMPFDVNVTTDESVYEAADTASRAKAVIFGSGWPGIPSSGNAWLRGFGDSSNEKDTVTVKGYINSSTRSADEVATITSHELGHLFDIRDTPNGNDPYHTGGGDWGPIMGSTATKDITQWYTYYKLTDAMGKHIWEDQVGIIGNELGFRDDDHGNTVQTASQTTSGIGTIAEGFIGAKVGPDQFQAYSSFPDNGKYHPTAIQDDVDIFKYTFTSDQTLQFKVTPLSNGANLDAILKVYDSNGTLLKTEQPSDSLNASVNYTGQAGDEIYLSVEGGAGTYSYKYGSLGSYKVNASEVSMDTAKVSIEDASANESDGSISFKVTLENAAENDFSLTYFTGQGEASAYLDPDYKQQQGTITFKAGETEKTISINIHDDNQFEGNETFNVRLVSSQNSGVDVQPVELVDDTAVGTIIDNETKTTTTTNANGTSTFGNDLLFSSHAEAEKVLFLNFFGREFGSGFWAGELRGSVTSAYSTDKDVIYNLWSQVAEDYAPFNVNVTTDKSVFDATDQSNRAEAVILGSFDDPDRQPNWSGSMPYDGKAKLGEFDWESNYRALRQKFGEDEATIDNNIQQFKAQGWDSDTVIIKGGSTIANTISHELGHLFGLDHLGIDNGKKTFGIANKDYHPGYDGWAPILGDPSNPNMLTQWSKGDYKDATHRSESVQTVSTADSVLDQLAVLASKLDGYRIDDHGNDTNNASNLYKTANSGYMSEGLITQNTDVDVFAFTAVNSGNVTFSAAPLAIGANLNILLKLYDANGNLIPNTTVNEYHSLGASLNYEVTEGTTYYVSIEGGRYHDTLPKNTHPISDSDYGSLGYYQVGVFNELTTDGDDVIIGAFGDRTLNGGKGNDKIYGNDGNDTLIGGADNDLIDGGKGSDTADYSSSNNDINVDLSVTTAQDTGEGNDTLVNVENLTGGSGNDTLTGNEEANNIRGGEGNNTLKGKGGDDVLMGGSDTDTLDGGEGNDTVDYSTSSTKITVDLSNTTSQVTGEGNDTFISIENVKGGTGDDEITGNTEDNVLIGGQGNNTLAGGAGDDTLSAGSNDDTFDGGSGIDTVDYTITNHHLTIDLSSTDVQNTGYGNDKFTNIENIIVGNGNNTLTGNSSDNTITSGGGDDTLSGGLGNDTLDGGKGNDTVDFSAANIGITADLKITTSQQTGEGNDTLLNIENITGSSKQDTLTGNLANNILKGGAGDDTLRGEDGKDELKGGADKDSLYGGAGDDTLKGQEGMDKLWGDSGDDNLDGGGDKDTLYGGDGNDTLEGGDDEDNLYGNDGTDTLKGGAGDDILEGGKGNDILEDTEDNNTFKGGEGNDTLKGGTGDDSFDGGEGVDTVNYSHITENVTIDLTNTQQQNTGAGNDTFQSIENISTGTGNDTVTGNADDNILHANWGNNTIRAGDGDDKLIGFDNNDIFDGGEGTDTVDYSWAWFEVKIDLNITDQQNTGGNGEDTFISIENIIGGSAGNKLTGNDLSNTLFAGGGQTFNTLKGEGGDDTIVFGGASYNNFYGGEGIDTLDFSHSGVTVNFNLGVSINVLGSGSDASNIWNRDNGFENVKGSSLNDNLTGNSENNVIEGGAGSDTLTGQGGADTFKYTDLSHSTSAAYDTITDFTVGEDSLEFNVPYAKSDLTFSIETESGHNYLTIKDSDNIDFKVKLENTTNPTVEQLNIKWVNPLPETDDVSAKGAKNSQSIEITLSGNDDDDGGTITSFNLDSLPSSSEGTLYLDSAFTQAVTQNTDYSAANNELTLYFKPATDFTGDVDFNYHAIDDTGLADSTPNTATINVVEVYNSNLGATNVLYLDMDGHTFSDSFWQHTLQGKTATAYTTDQAKIFELWSHVAEDYFPFDVNITTDESVFEATDAAHRGKAVIMGTIEGHGAYNWLPSGTNDIARGSARDDTFGKTHDSWGREIDPDYGYDTVLVTGYKTFTGEERAPDFSGLIASHELGHLVGLEHVLNESGLHQGHGNWGPIMGMAGNDTSVKELTQWSKIESGSGYSYKLQDSVGILGKKLGFKDDDHGDDTSNATTITNTAKGFMGAKQGAEHIVPPEGMSEAKTYQTSIQKDEDVFKLDVKAHHEYTITANTLKNIANLDVVLKQLDANGDEVQSYNPSDSLNASFQYTATNDSTLFFSVQSNGGYGSLGQYTVTVDTVKLNDAPTANADTQDIDEDTNDVTGNLLTNDTDPDDGDTLTVTSINDVTDSAKEIIGTYGTLTWNTNGSYTYTLDNSKVQNLNVDDEREETFNYTIKDEVGESSTSTVTIKITGSNDDPVISGSFTNTLTEDTTSAVTGSLSISDVDNTVSFNDAAEIASDNSYGTFKLTNGTWEYKLDTSKVQNLNDNETETDSYTFTATDGTQQQVTVNIAGSDDASVVSGTYAASLTEDSTSAATGTLNISDVDDEVSFSDVAATNGDNNYGQFSLTNGTWSYNLNPSSVQHLDDGDTATDTYTFTATDGTQQQVTVNIAGSDDASVVSGTYAASLTEDSTSAATDTLNISDVDDEVSFNDVAATNGDNNYGQFSLTNGTWSYNLNASSVQHLDDGDTATDTYTFAASDGTQQQVTVNIAGSDDASVVSGTYAASLTEDSTSAATGTLNISDVDDEVSFNDVAATNGDNNYGQFSLTSGTWSYNLNASSVQHLDDGETATDTYTFTATDGTQQQVTVNIAGSDDASVVSGTYAASLTEDSTSAATGILNISDVDDEVSFNDVAATNGDNSYGQFSLTNGIWSYNLNASSVQHLDDGDTATDTYTFTATDGTQQQVTVNIAGSDDASVVSGTYAASLTEDSTSAATGTLNISDVDVDDEVSFSDVAATNGDNNYGQFSLTNGTWSYNLNASSVQHLDDGDTATDTYTFTATDGTQQQVTVNIAGSDDASVVSGTYAASLTEDSTSAATGTLNISDVDVDVDDEVSFNDVAATNGDNSYGQFSLTNGNWSYNLNPSSVQHLGGGETAIDTYTFTATDGTQQQVTVNIAGSDDASVVSGTYAASLTEDSTSAATGELNISDVDDEVSFNDVAATNGDNNYGQFSLTNGNWSYNLNPSSVQHLGGGETAIDTYTFTATDGTQQQVVVTIAGQNDVAVITGGDTGSVFEDGELTASGQLNVVDVDAGESGFQATLVNNPTYGTFSIGSNGTWAYTLDETNATVQRLNSNETLSDIVTVQSVDGTAHNISITINGYDFHVVNGSSANETIDMASRGSLYEVRDEIYGNGGIDRILGQVGDDKIYGGDGDDHLVGNQGNDLLYGGSDVDNLFGASGEDTLHGDSGDDWLYGGDDRDVIFGGQGGDNLRGENGDDDLWGGRGNDWLYGGNGRDFLHGGGENDVLRVEGNAHDQIAIGGNGADYVYVTNGASHSHYHGDDANYALNNGWHNDGSQDTIDFSQAAGRVRIDLETHTSLPGNWFGYSKGTIYEDGFGGVNSFITGFEVLIATNHSDHIDGTVNGETIRGVGGDDWLRGRGGDDVLEGGDGVDNLFGELGNDNLRGGSGNDWLYGGEGGDWLYGGEGADNLRGENGADNLRGEAGDDWLYGAEGGDWLYGGQGADVMDGGAGNDTASYEHSTTRVVVNLSDNTAEIGGDAQGDTLINIENLVGSNHDDILVGDSGRNILHGRGGEDILNLNGGAYYQIAIGGNGADYVYVTNGASHSHYHGDDANYALNNGWHNDGSQDTIDFSQAAGRVHIDLETHTSLPGNWFGYSKGTIYEDGFGGVDSFITGFEVLIATNHSDYIYGTVNAETIRGAGGDDWLQGRGGDDVLEGGGGVDNLFGEHGNDNLRGDSGNDWLYGGEGSDWLYGGEGADNLRGENGADNLRGEAGDDWLYGNNGGDTLEGGDGVDNLLGGSGNDWLYGGEGSDWLYGGEGADNLRGENGADNLRGEAGDDWLYGNNGGDTLEGGDGVDNLFGGVGNDTLKGGSNDDWLYGEEGRDNLYGGSGVDTFVYRGLSESTTEGWDNILDFEVGVDRIYLQGPTFNESNLVITRSGSLSTVEQRGSNFWITILSDQAVTADDILF